MITQIDSLKALPFLLELLRQRVEAGAGEDEFSLIARAIELINERRPVFKDETQDVYYIGAEEPSRAPYRVTATTCTCPRANEQICKHRLLVNALLGIAVDTTGFTYTKRGRTVVRPLPKEEETPI